MLRRLAAAILAAALAPAALAPAALAENSTCRITYQNKSGSDFKGEASLWKGETLQIGGTTYSNAKNGTFPFTLNNDSTLVIQAVQSKQCNIVTSIANQALSATLKSEVEATGSGGNNHAFCKAANENFDRYGCSCTQDSEGAHHAELTMTCVGKQ